MELNGIRTKHSLASGAIVCALGCIGLALTSCGSTSKSGGAGTGTGGRSGSKVITIGADVPESGSLASLASFGQGTMAYFDYVNAKGGINGYTFQYKILDSEGNPSVSVSDAVKLVSQDHVFAYVGNVGTPEVEAVLPYLQAQGVADVAPITAGLTAATPSSFVAYPTANADGAFMAQYAITHLTKTHTVGFLYEDNANGKAYIHPFQYEASKLGTRLDMQVFEPGTTDLTPQLSKLKAAGADVVMLSSQTDAVAPAMNTANSLNYHPYWLTVAGDTSPQLFATLPAAEVSKYQWSSGNPLSGSAVNAINAALKKYEPNVSPSINVIAGWASGSLFGIAFGRLTAHGGTPTRAGLIKTLDNFTNVSTPWESGITWSPRAGAESAALAHLATPAEAMYGFVDGSTKELTPFTAPPSIPAT